MDLQSIALELRGKGLNVLPLTPGTKRPLGDWGKYQTTVYDGPFDAFDGGFGVVSGRISGGLVIFDVDGGEMVFSQFCRGVLEIKKDVLEDVVVERSPSKGFHIAYRCPDLSEISPQVWSKNGLVQIELRGDRQFTVISPTRGYQLLRGDWTSLPTKTTLEHELFVSIASKFGEGPVEREGDRQVREVSPEEVGGQRTEIGKNGGTYKVLLDQDIPRRILKSLGAVKISSNLCRSGCFGQLGNIEEYWRRPGKDDESHGITYFPTIGITYCFSTNASPLLPDTGYTAADLYSTVVLGRPVSMSDGDSVERKKAIHEVLKALTLRKNRGIQ